MTLTSWLIIAVVIWFIILIIDISLKACFSNGYTDLINRLGVKIRPHYISIYMTRYNNSFNRKVFKYAKFFDIWFNFGLIATFITIPIALIIIIDSLFSIIFHTNQTSLQPVIPGLNLPLFDTPFYFLALFFCVLFHELGHFLAAVRENIKVHGISLFVTVFIVCGCVNINVHEMVKLSSRSRLKIVSAGIWHNLVLAFFAGSVLLINPFIYEPFYYNGQGVTVANIQSNSGAGGLTGLQHGDTVISLNRYCHIKDKIDWRSCLIESIGKHNKGHCVTNEFIKKEQFHSLDSKCCGEESSSNLCFQIIEDHNKSCLPARALLDSSVKICNTSSQCSTGSFCLETFSPEGIFRLIEINRIDKKSVLFWGPPENLYEEVTVIIYRPKYQWLPLYTLYIYENILKYIISISLSLAIINAVPCYLLDGSHMIGDIIGIIFKSRLPLERRLMIEKILTIIGTLLISSCIILTFSNYIFSNLRF